MSSTIWSPNPLESVAFFGDLARSRFVPFFARAFTARIPPQFRIGGDCSSLQDLFGCRALRPHVLGGRRGLAMTGEIHDPGQVAGHLPSCESKHSGVFWLQMQHAGNCRGIRDVRWRPQGRLAGLTTQVSVCLQASLSGACTRHCKVGWNLLATSEVHFVGRLPGEGCMGNYGVVLLDVECDQFLKGSEAVERMQIEPAMFERTETRLSIIVFE